MRRRTGRFLIFFPPGLGNERLCRGFGLCRRSNAEQTAQVSIPGIFVFESPCRKQSRPRSCGRPTTENRYHRRDSFVPVKAFQRAVITAAQPVAQSVVTDYPGAFPIQ